MIQNTYTIEEISKHNTVESLWIIIDDHVFDVTKYAKKHPGGSRILLKYAGKDCTKEFNDINHTDASHLLDDLCIGKVKI